MCEISTNSAVNLRTALSDCAQVEGLVQRFLASLNEAEAQRLLTDWAMWAREDQLPPLQAQGGGPWNTWLVLGGRGAGRPARERNGCAGWRWVALPLPTAR